MDTINNLNEDDADLVATNKTAKAELETTKQTLDDKQAEAEQALADAKAYKATIEQKQQEYNDLYNSLNEEYRQLVAQEEEARRQEEARAAAAYTPAVTTRSSSSGSSKSSSSGGQSYSGNAAVDRAYSCLGLPYVWGGVGPNGYDCSGLVGYALQGDYTRHYVASDFCSYPTASNPQPGDVVSCSSHHCGLYIGNGQMIEAPHTGAVVKISAVRGRVVRM